MLNKEKGMTLLYPIRNSLYVNITNLCCCKCVFCIRNITDSVGGSDSLWLDHEPTMEELKQELERHFLASLNQFGYIV